LSGRYAFPFGEGGTPKGVTEEVKTWRIFVKFR